MARRGPKRAWTAEGIGEGFAGVTLAGGRIYTTGNVGGKTMVTALDLDGNVKWQEPNGRAWSGDPGGTRGTPTYDDGRLFHESPLGELIAMDATSGEKIWSLNILKEFQGKNITRAHPVVCGGRLYLRHAEKLYAYDVKGTD